MDLIGAFEGTSADQLRRIGNRFRIVLRNVIVAVVRGNGRTVILCTLEYRTDADAAVDLSGNTVAVALGEHSAVDEEAFFDGIEVSAELLHVFEEQNGTFFELTRFLL